MTATGVDVIPADQLTVEQTDTWARLQQADPFLGNPFFSAEFTQQVARVRNDVEVAMVRRGEEYVGFLPFERGPHGIGRPVGSRISAVHGIVADPALDWNVLHLLRDAGLAGWHYECVPATHAGLRRFHFCERRFPYVDLSDGYEAYRQGHRDRGSSFFPQLDRKARKMTREIGPLEFELHTVNEEIFRTLQRWKSAQYHRTGTLDVLAFDWVEKLLANLRTLNGPGCAGVLSVLRSGERLVAVHFGIRSEHVLSWWFPTYDPDLARYSPGLILIDRILQAAAGSGIRRLDLGQGPERYKAQLRSGTFPVAEGAADRRWAQRWFRRIWVRTREWAGRSPAARTPLRVFRAVRNRGIRG